MQSLLRKEDHMVGFLLLSHGDLSNGLLSTCECILGIPDKTAALSLAIEDNIDIFERKIREMIHELDDGDGVLVMTDVFGGTPCNKCSLMLKDENIELLTGLNFPMIAAAYEKRMTGSCLKEIRDYCLTWAKDGIISMRERLNLEGRQ